METPEVQKAIDEAKAAIASGEAYLRTVQGFRHVHYKGIGKCSFCSSIEQDIAKEYLVTPRS
jgi:hypothetical protein